jgi:hypothetical protein
MKRIIEIKGENEEGIQINSKNKITIKELKSLETFFKAINSFEPYTTEDGWYFKHNFPKYHSDKDIGEKSIEELYLKTKQITENQLNTFIKFVPEDMVHITDIDILLLFH